jgi:hypothetical protein
MNIKEQTRRGGTSNTVNSVSVGGLLGLQVNRLEKIMVNLVSEVQNELNLILS